LGFVESLIDLDQAVFLAWTNWGPEWVDLLFRAITAHVGTYLLLGLFSFWAFKHMAVQEGVLLVALLVAAIVLSDWISVHAFKDVFQRLRPCHDPELAEQFTIAAPRCGGSYGFVSSHAATIWAAWAVVRAAQPARWILFVATLWAVAVSYSRIYLGVHYPGDVLGGAVLGLSVSTVLMA
jgi:undecaprenyl-diphosphatase